MILLLLLLLFKQSSRTVNTQICEYVMHEKQKIKRWLYSRRSNWHHSSWWSTDKEHKNGKLELSSKEPFSEISDFASSTEKDYYNYLYFYTIKIYRETCHLSFHTPNSKVYKQCD